MYMEREQESEILQIFILAVTAADAAESMVTL